MKNDAYRMHDMVLYNGRYYLYHGAGPAIVLFAPWRMLTGHDLPENFAVFLFCAAGVLAYAAALFRLLKVSGRMPGSVVLVFLLLALGVCQGVPYLCGRIGVYEIPIAAGFFAVGGALCFLVYGLSSDRAVAFLAASGVMFGLAVACRPHLGLAGVACLAALAIRRRAVTPFLIPFAACCSAVLVYNYARFGNPLEFGVGHLLAGDASQRGLHLSPGKMIPGLYYMLMSPPDVSAVFPWIRLALRLPFNAASYPFPAGYFLEPVMGAFFLAPFVLLAFRSSGEYLSRLISRIALTASGAILLFVSAIGLTSQRYVVDFLPLAVFAAVIQITIRPQAAVFVLILYSVVANLALGITGPYNDMLASRPVNYARIARWFSPIDRFRPIVNPAVRIDVEVEPSSEKGPAITIGRQAFRHAVYLQRAGAELLVALHSSGAMIAETKIPYEEAGVRVGLSFQPERGQLVVAVNGKPELVHALPTLVLAPAEVVIGGNGLPGFAREHFNGRVKAVESVVAPQAIKMGS